MALLIPMVNGQVPESGQQLITVWEPLHFSQMVMALVSSSVSWLKTHSLWNLSVIVWCFSINAFCLGAGSLMRRNVQEEWCGYLPLEKPINLRMVHRITHLWDFPVIWGDPCLLVDMCISVVYKYTCTHAFGMSRIFYKVTCACSCTMDTWVNTCCHKYNIYRLNKLHHTNIYIIFLFLYLYI